MEEIGVWGVSLYSHNGNDLLSSHLSQQHCI